MKALVIYFSIIGIIFVLVPQAYSQSEFGKEAIIDGYRKIEIGRALSAMPETGSRAEDFVPPHWIIFGKADGDLNADGVKDSALILTINDKDTKYISGLEKLVEDKSWISGIYLIVVVDSHADKNLHFDSVNYEIGQMPAGERDAFTVTIKKNVLDVYVDAGGSMRVEQTYHFRINPPTGGELTLIGYDEQHDSVMNSDRDAKFMLSENYLTNIRVDSTYKVRRGEFVPTKKKTTIPPVRLYFNEVTGRNRVD
jgi:hypothetical protein